MEKTIGMDIRTQEVLATFEKYGLSTMATANHGSITISVKKEGYSISTAENEKTALSIPLNE